MVILCPTCQESVPPQTGSGRPRIYCSAECRKEMIGLRRELGDLEEEIVDARYKLSTDYWPGTHYWRGTIRRLELAIEQIRRRLPAETIA